MAVAVLQNVDVEEAHSRKKSIVSWEAQEGRADRSALNCWPGFEAAASLSAEWIEQ